MVKQRTRLYRIWNNMRSRCENNKCPAYKNYGDRGIVVCEEWKTYKNFESWALHNGYSDDLTLDRIDINGNYCKNNCRWVTMKSQCRNRRTNRYLTYNGETHLEVEWAEILGIDKDRISDRLYRGWSVDKALSTPVKKYNKRSQ